MNKISKKNNMVYSSHSSLDYFKIKKREMKTTKKKILRKRINERARVLKFNWINWKNKNNNDRDTDRRAKISDEYAHNKNEKKIERVREGNEKSLNRLNMINSNTLNYNNFNLDFSVSLTCKGTHERVHFFIHILGTVNTLIYTDIHTRFQYLQL